ncbi:hypothetical protein A8B78_22015 [Jannaschia sp. EhC01]|nr:hypothetical protein A8B78_22015 [Jannaschia sp. EhC01]
MKKLACGLALALSATPLTAQTWTANTFANESLLFAGVSPPEPSMHFGCTAPAPENRPLIETGSHESHRTEAFETTVGFFDPLFEWSPPYVISGIVITVDGTSYQLPPLDLNELQGSAIYLPMTDPFILSLFTAQSLTFDTGQGTAYAYPVDGLADGLREAFGYCNARWVELGTPMPPALAAVMGDAPLAPPAPAAASLPAPIVQQAAASCMNGAGTITREELQSADFDGDGQEDFILNHASVTCTDGMSGFCGAANCSIDVFLSSLAYQQPRELLGIGAEIVPLADGRTGIQIAGSFSLCGQDGLCPGPQVWDGTSFVLFDGGAVQSAPTPTVPKD